MSKISWDNMVSTEFVDDVVLRLIGLTMGGYHENGFPKIVEHLKSCKEISVEQYGDFSSVRCKVADDYSHNIYTTKNKKHAELFVGACKRIAGR